MSPKLLDRLRILAKESWRTIPDNKLLQHGYVSLTIVMWCVALALFCPLFKKVTK